MNNQRLLANVRKLHCPSSINKAHVAPCFQHGSALKTFSKPFHTSLATPQFRYVDDSTRGPGRSGLRISTLFGITVAFGLFGIGYGIYDIYSSMTTWPSEIRQDLRIAVRAKQRGDYKASAEYFKKAYGKAIDLPTFTEDRAYKTSAVALALADVLETGLGDITAAYDVYSTALNDLKMNGSLLDENGSSKMNAKERTRAIGIVVKLTELGGRLRNVDDELEERLGWALEEMLKNMNLDTAKGDEKEDKGVKELELPRWSGEGIDVVAVLEKAGQHYASRGKIEYAVPLYLHAISSILPPSQAQQRKEQSEAWIHIGSSKIPSPGDRCKAGTLMNNLASLFATPTPNHRTVNIPQAKAWASKALEIISKARDSYTPSKKQLTEDQMICEDALAAVLFNLGMLSEMGRQEGEAVAHYERALQHATDIGMAEGVQEARAALKRLKETERRAQRIGGVKP